MLISAIRTGRIWKDRCDGFVDKRWMKALLFHFNNIIHNIHYLYRTIYQHGAV